MRIGGELDVGALHRAGEMFAEVNDAPVPWTSLGPLSLMITSLGALPHVGWWGTYPTLLE